MFSKFRNKHKGNPMNYEWVENPSQQKNVELFRNLTAAACGDNGEDQQRIAQTVLEWGNLLLQKNTDYSSSVWQTPILAPECSTSSAIRVRMSDKISRIHQLLSSGKSLVDESLEDSIRDLGAYCLLLLAAPKPKSKQKETIVPRRTKGRASRLHR